KQPGQLQWGATSQGGAPYVYPDPSDSTLLVGFEYEIAEALSQCMGIQQKEVETDYSQLDEALQAGKFDVILNGWESTTERQKSELFTQSYYRYGQQIVVRANDKRFSSLTANDVLGLKALEGFTVGTGAGLKAADLLSTDSQITLKTYDPALPFDDLDRGRIDAVLIDLPVVAYYVLGAGAGAQPDKKLRLIGKPFALGDYVIALKKAAPGATLLLKMLNQAITELKNNGTLHNILEKWQLWNDQQASIGTN
ncbi:MAG TPA: ABC transporter substrate-binding protein, partial [Ktedonobacteraceae bacterium]